MKVFWNSLLISLGILLPTSTVLAQSPKTSELASPNVSNLEVVAEAVTETDVADEGATTTDSESVEEAEHSDTTVETDTLEQEQTTDTPSLPEDADQTEATTQETDTSEETQTTPNGEENTEAKEPELTPEEIARRQKLIEADQLYKSGQIAAAEQLYREAKDPLQTEAAETEEEPEPFYDPKELSPAGGVYWRQSAAGLAQQLETKTLVPLQFLVEQEPSFIPGYLRYAEALEAYDQDEEALQVLERAATLYPNEPELLKATVTELAEAEQLLEASLAARQFALLNPENPLSGEFETLADEYLESYKSRLRSKLRGNAIANVITGALGYIFTGNLFGPISAIETTTLMLRGESAVGERIANRVQRQLPMLEDEEVLAYVREVGSKLTNVAGRDEFEYEFHVIMDDQLNAFALPGGKVFVNAGAILKTNSEAELAGLLAHELAHAVLSHGFQLVTEGNLIANVTQYIPFGGTATNLIVLDYNRDMERQADALGTRILVGGGYAADGLYNLMVTLEQQEKEEPIFAWLSTHPDTQERINNLQTQIERNGYNRYTYEGVERHLAMQKRVGKLLDEYKKRQECEEDEECREKLENEEMEN